MTRKVTVVLLNMLLCIAVLSAFSPAAFSQSSKNMLKMVFIEVDSPQKVKKLARMGIDIAAVRKLEDAGKRELKAARYRVEAVVSSKDEKKLAREGLDWSIAVSRRRAMAAEAMRTAESVYHSFEEPTLGIKDQLYQITADYPDISYLTTIGYSIQSRPLLAMCLSKKNARRGRRAKPELLILATHHAREWVATEMAMRLIKYLTANYGTDDRVTSLLDTSKVWIVPVANPDGYQYTFDHERLWRKNLRDNDGDGEITIADGVDPNRNFASHWGLDDEGSSPIWSDATYRGTAPNSEPETRAVVKFIKRHRFKFVISYHTYSNLILYPWGWQVRTPSFDDPIFVAQAGTDENPAIWDSILDQGYDPGVGADLYTTNGDFTDWTYDDRGIPSYVVELTSGQDAEGNFYGFEFPDDEEMVQTVFEDNLEFALSVAESAAHPANPVSPVGIEVEGVYHTPVAMSYGESQGVEILARKELRPILLYKVNDAGWRFARFKEMLGTVYNDRPGAHFSKYQAKIRGQHPEDQVTYRIFTWGTTLGPYSYTVESASGNRILILSAEDYTGEHPVYEDPSGPNYLQYYTDALDAAGYSYDVWDTTVQGAAPSASDVLSHYDTVIWYTGDDFAPTVPGFEIHEDIVLGIRGFVNYHRGKLFATGQDLAWLSSVYGMFNDDFFQYYLGAFMHVEGAGMDSATELPYGVIGESGDPIFDGLSFSLNGGTGADNQHTADSFLATSHFLPHFDNAVAAKYDRPGGPFDPHSGNYYVYTQMADSAYKRLGRTVMLPDGNPELKFWMSHDIESDWDYAFVEIREVGTDDWTTLPDENGSTTQETGESCIAEWVDEIHPHLGHFMDSDCNPTGSTGEWHAFTGNSGGWQQVIMDLTAYAGKEVEIHISYATDWGTQNLGVFVDDIELPGQPLEDFESGLGAWEVSTTPENAPFNNWIHMTGAGFPEGPAIRTSDSVYLGFGFEAIDTDANRTEVMDRIMEYLLD